MVTSQDCLKKYGNPINQKNMVMWDVPAELEIGIIPKKIFCNQDLIIPLNKALYLLKDRGLIEHIRTYDGCFNIRAKKSSRSYSLHSWGIAIDIDAAWNGFGKRPTMDLAIVKCFKEAGFDWGGDWKTPDGMHFQLKEI